MAKVFFTLLCLFLLQLPALVNANGLQPKGCPVDEKYLLGLYTGNGEQLLVREQGGVLNVLYRYLPEDKDYQKSIQSFSPEMVKDKDMFNFRQFTYYFAAVLVFYTILSTFFGSFFRTKTSE